LRPASSASSTCVINVEVARWCHARPVRSAPWAGAPDGPTRHRRSARSWERSNSISRCAVARMCGGGSSPMDSMISISFRAVATRRSARHSSNSTKRSALRSRSNSETLGGNGRHTALVIGCHPLDRRHPGVVVLPSAATSAWCGPRALGPHPARSPRSADRVRRTVCPASPLARRRSYLR
jgi:hypothetical protein